MGPNSKKPARNTSKVPTRDSGRGNSQSSASIESQQLILDCFSKTFVDDPEKVKATIQQVKGHLFDRDFIAAFSTADLRAAYIARWSPTRALAYAGIFSGLQPLQNDETVNDKQLNHAPKILCIGGGAGAEVVALSLTSRLNNLSDVQVVAVDIADWADCLERLNQAIAKAPSQPDETEETVISTTTDLSSPVDHDFQLSFHQHDVLKMSESQLRPFVQGTDLITIMFTLNELFTTSMSLTTSFLLTLTDLAEAGSWLLIVDSPGSYSEVQLGKEGKTKQYPMKWLVDYTLLTVAGKEENGKAKWTQEDSNDSRWFRMDSKLQYPINLEDMRYQIHLYRRAEKARRNTG